MIGFGGAKRRFIVSPQQHHTKSLRDRVRQYGSLGGIMKGGKLNETLLEVPRTHDFPLLLASGTFRQKKKKDLRQSMKD